ncbi:MAG: NAD-dependent deacylase [Eubacteriales bacterium]|nr:NAD-dependent deacylase [Eubacteriales bacterium]
MGETSHKINELASLLKNAHYTVILTGAGMSTESGIPDFRSREGLWQKFDPMRVARPETIREDYDAFHGFYKMRVETLKECKPHEGHLIVARMEKEGIVKTLVTQNVDDFHRIAGSEKVYNLHGSIRTFRCHDCLSPADETAFLGKKPCGFCGGRLRPNVVLFGEGLPHNDLNEAISEIEKADLIIVIGTSLRVYPVNQLPFMAKAIKVYINREMEFQSSFDLTIQGSAKDVLVELEKLL